MNSGVEIDFRNPALIRKLGMAALEKELGVVGTAYFLRQFSQGQGDYTAEREKLFEGITLDEIIKSAKEFDKLHP